MKFKEQIRITKKINKDDFISEFKKIFEDRDIDFATEFIDNLTFKKRDLELVGQLKKGDFKIKRNERVKYNILKRPTAIARGKIFQKDNETIIDISVNGFNYGLIPFQIILIILIFASLSSILFNNGDGIGLFLFSLLGLILINYSLIHDKNKLTTTLKEKIDLIK